MEITVKVDDKLIQEVKDARSTLTKLKAAIDKARKAACKWFDLRFKTLSRIRKENQRSSYRL